MRRIDLPLTAAACWTVAGAYAVLAEWPVAARTALGLPLVALLPGYALSRIVFGARLKADQRLVVSLALSLALDAFGGIGLSLSPWGITSRSWAIGLSTSTLLFALFAASVGPVVPRRQVRWHASRPAALTALVALLCAFVVTAAIAASRQPSDPPPWASGYTLLWLLPKASGQVEVGVQSGEFSPHSYRVVIMIRNQPTMRWDTGTIRPAGKWARLTRVPRSTRIDAYLYRLGDGERPYRHVYLNPVNTG